MAARTRRWLSLAVAILALLTWTARCTRAYAWTDDPDAGKWHYVGDSVFPNAAFTVGGVTWPGSTFVQAGPAGTYAPKSKLWLHFNWTAATASGLRSTQRRTTGGANDTRVLDWGREPSYNASEGVYTLRAANPDTYVRHTEFSLLQLTDAGGWWHPAIGYPQIHAQYASPTGGNGHYIGWSALAGHGVLAMYGPGTWATMPGHTAVIDWGYRKVGSTYQWRYVLTLNALIGSGAPGTTSGTVGWDGLTANGLTSRTWETTGTSATRPTVPVMATGYTLTVNDDQYTWEGDDRFGNYEQYRLIRSAKITSGETNDADIANAYIGGIATLGVPSEEATAIPSAPPGSSVSTDTLPSWLDTAKDFVAPLQIWLSQLISSALDPLKSVFLWPFSLFDRLKG